MIIIPHNNIIIEIFTYEVGKWYRNKYKYQPHVWRDKLGEQVSTREN